MKKLLLLLLALLFAHKSNAIDTPERTVFTGGASVEHIIRIDWVEKNSHGDESEHSKVVHREIVEPIGNYVRLPAVRIDEAVIASLTPVRIPLYNVRLTVGYNSGVFNQVYPIMTLQPCHMLLTEIRL